jgi:hypothetical protein
MDRETKKITTPSGKVVELKTYLTAGENRKVTEAYIGSVRPETDEKGRTTKMTVDGEGISRAEDRLIEVAVVSFDGSGENILQRILDGSPDDYQFLMQEINQLKKGFPTAK